MRQVYEEKKIPDGCIDGSRPADDASGLGFSGAAPQSTRVCENPPAYRDYQAPPKEAHNLADNPLFHCWEYEYHYYDSPAGHLDIDDDHYRNADYGDYDGDDGSV